MSNERFGIGGDAEGGVWTPTPLYLDSLVDTVVDSPTDGFVLTYEASSGKWKAKAAGAGADTKTYVYEAGVQVGTVARYVNFAGADFNVTEDVDNDWFLIEIANPGISAHDMTGAYHTEDATGGAGNVIRATGPTAFAWAALAHGDLSDAPVDAHHVRYADSEVESVITAEIVDGQSIDVAIDSLISTHSGVGDVHHTAYTDTDTEGVITAELVDGQSIDLAIDSLISIHAGLSDAHHAESHDFDTHTGDVDLADFVAGSQGSIIRCGGTDWEELVKGTQNYALVAGATDISWAQYDYTWLASIPSTFDPTSHGSSAHTGNIIPAANQDLGAFFIDIDDIAVPADPAATIRRLFVNTATGKLSVKTNASETISLEEQGGTDVDAIHDNVDAEISAIAEKTSPVGTDMILIEDSAAGNAKKMVQITNLPGGADADAIHDNVADEIHQIALKGTPVSADEIVIEDSVDSWNKKRIIISSLPAGSPSFGLPVSIDIGDAQAEGTSGDSVRADHQHAFAAPGAGYPLDVAATESDGVATTVARSDHVHAHGTGYSANAHHNQAHVLSGTDHTASGLTIGHAIIADSTTTFSWQSPSYYNSFMTDFAAESLANLTIRNHGSLSDAPADAHHVAFVSSDFTTAFAAESLANLTTRAHGNLSDAPTDAHHNEIHVLATTGPHSGTLPVADIANGTQYQYLRAGSSTPEFQARTFTIATTIKSPTVGYTTVWRAPFGCTCTKLEGRQKGGTSTIINARYNGSTDVATGDLILTAADTWYSTTGINQTAWSATDWLEIEVQTLGGATEITFVLTFTEP